MEDVNNGEGCVCMCGTDGYVGNLCIFCFAMNLKLL